MIKKKIVEVKETLKRGAKAMTSISIYVPSKADLILKLKMVRVKNNNKQTCD